MLNCFIPWRYSLFCSHYRAHEWFFDSIDNHHCQFVGVLCPTYDMFLAGECACDSYTKHPHTCAPMGFDADTILPNKSPKKLMRFFPQGKWFDFKWIYFSIFMIFSHFLKDGSFYIQEKLNAPETAYFVHYFKNIF